MSLTYAELVDGQPGRRQPSRSLRILLGRLERRPSYVLEVSAATGLDVSSLHRMCEWLVERDLAKAHRETGDPHRLGRPLRVYYALTDRGRDLARTELHGR